MKTLKLLTALALFSTLSTVTTVAQAATGQQMQANFNQLAVPFFNTARQYVIANNIAKNPALGVISLVVTELSSKDHNDLYYTATGTIYVKQQQPSVDASVKFSVDIVASAPQGNTYGIAAPSLGAPQPATSYNFSLVHASKVTP